MLGDDDEGVFNRLWGRVAGRFRFFELLWIIKRPETLTILDYRPTFIMLLTIVGFVGFSGAFAYMLVNDGLSVPIGLWATGIPAAACLFFSLRCTIREAYYFDKTTDS